MTDVGCANDKCCGGGGCRIMQASHRPEEDCKNYVPKMKFAGFGRTYVPQQRLCELFSAKEGFVAGTIFPELHIPYEGKFAAQNLETKEADDFA